MTKNEDLKAFYITDLQWKLLREIKCKVSELQAQPACKILASDLEMWIYNIKDSPSATRPTVIPTDTAMEDAVTREDTVRISDRQKLTSSTTDGDAERALENLYYEPYPYSPDDSKRDYEILKAALQSTRKPDAPYIQSFSPDKIELNAEEQKRLDAINKASDTINIKIEELLRIKMVLERCSLFNLNEIVHERVKVSIASLDAVLSEGE